MAVVISVVNAVTILYYRLAGVKSRNIIEFRETLTNDDMQGQMILSLFLYAPILFTCLFTSRVADHNIVFFIAINIVTTLISVLLHTLTTYYVTPQFLYYGTYDFSDSVRPNEPVERELTSTPIPIPIEEHAN
jgi:hypothetical protein